MLRLAEEIMLLILDDDSGEFARVPAWPLRCALAGGVLMDLALENRIDTDLERLFLVDATPLGDDLLDPVLAGIAETSETYDARYWVQHTAEHAGRIRERALARLVERGIVRRRDKHYFWVFRSRRYPTIDGKADRDVKLRIMTTLFSDTIPDPRDIAIVGLADTCGIFRELLSRRELEHASKRIEQVRNFDLIGRAVAWAVPGSRTPPERQTVHAVGTTSELPAPGSLVSMFSEDREFVIANVDGHYHALDGLCEHAGARLIDGQLSGCHLACPRHGWIYDVSDGRLVSPPLARRRIASYSVRMNGEEVELVPKAPPSGDR